MEGMYGFPDPDEPIYGELMEEARVLLAVREFVGCLQSGMAGVPGRTARFRVSRPHGGRRRTGGTGRRRDCRCRAGRQTRSLQPTRVGTSARYLCHAPSSAEPGGRRGRLGGCVERGHKTGKGEGGGLRNVQKVTKRGYSARGYQTSLDENPRAVSSR